MTAGPPSRRPDATQVVAIAAVVIAVLALSLAAAFLGGSARDEVADPAAYVRSFYEEGDVAGLLRALAPGSLPPEQLAQVEQDLSRILTGDVEVTATETFEVAGTTITRVETSDLLRWCVDPDGTVFVRCKLGEAAVDLDSGALAAPIAQVDVFPDRAQLVLGLSPAGDEPVTLEGTVELAAAGGAPAPLDRVQAAVATGRGLVPTPLDGVELQPGETLLLVYQGPVDAIVGERLVLTWDGGTLPIQVADRVEWLF